MKNGRIRLFLQSGSCYRYIVIKEEFDKALEALIDDMAD